MPVEGRKASYKWVIIGTTIALLTAIVLLLNSQHAPQAMRNLVPQLECPPPPPPAEQCQKVDSGTPEDPTPSPAQSAPDPHASQGNWTYEPGRDADEYGLSIDQCDAAFPGLFQEIDYQINERKRRPITEEELSRESWPAGTIRLMVHGGQLYVLDLFEPGIRRSRQYSVMLAINRALIASPRRHTIPDVEFVISIEDWTTDEGRPVWAFDRKPNQNNTWLMPDFGFFNWPEPRIGTYSEVRKRMLDVEERYASFADKEPKLFWRGAIVPAVAPVLRKHMVEAAAEQSWADLKVLNWEAEDPEKSNRVNIEDHCKYQFLINTEGRAWSGRLKYIQNCRSVIVAHKMEWIVPHEYLMVASGKDQNFIEVERDFSDLKEKMDYFMAHPDEAARIADNSANTFRDRYLTPAAEACYWRKLIYGWAEVSFKPKFYTGEGHDRKWRGVPFDSYVLMRKLEWDPY